MTGDAVSGAGMGIGVVAGTTAGGRLCVAVDS